MPVEGQAERLVTPLRQRDRRFLVVMGAVVVAAIIAVAVYAATRPSSAKGERCFTATFSASVGGATVHHCGAAAAHYCRFNASAPEVAQACRQEGFQVGSG
jgi:hypothetical protein